YPADFLCQNRWRYCSRPRTKVTCKNVVQQLATGRSLPSTTPMSTRPPPFFIADNVGLDFLNTIAVPVDTKVEWLTSGDDLLAWLEQTGLVPDDVLKDFRKNAPG